jgi:hypothetical protein
MGCEARLWPSDRGLAVLLDAFRMAFEAAKYPAIPDRKAVSCGWKGAHLRALTGFRRPRQALADGAKGRDCGLGGLLNNYRSTLGSVGMCDLSIEKNGVMLDETGYRFSRSQCPAALHH